MRRTLLIAGDVDRKFVDRVSADERFEVIFTPVRSEDELAAIIAPAHLLITRAYNRVTRRVIEAAPSLQLIAQGTSGTDNIDMAAASERGIAIVNLPGENATAVAELVVGCILSMTRTIPSYTRDVVNGRWIREDCATRHEMRHYRLGIVGLGWVGRNVARLARAFSMDVRAYDPYISDQDFADRGARRSPSLASLLSTSNIVTLHVPLNEETHQMIGRTELSLMRPGAYLVNAARGAVLDQGAALDALAGNHLAGLALDVYDPEPPSSPFPDDPRLILTPHIAGCSYECKRDIGIRLYELLSGWYS